ncbi:MAG: hypothetical protein AAFX07_00680 [Pseudomonadota bacterium]
MDFARLERHDGLQVLSFVEARDGDDGKYGPCLVTRCDPSSSVAVTEGPWPADDDGWDIAEKALATKDLAAFAKSAREMTRQLETQA